MKTFEVAIRKSRQRQFVRLCLTLGVVFLLCLALTVKVLTMLVYRNGQAVEERYLLAMRIAYPNIYSDNGRYKPTSILSGSYHDKQYKDLCGVPVYYGDYDVTYTLQGSLNNSSSSYPLLLHGDLYDSDTLAKIPRFFNVKAEESPTQNSLVPEQELAYLSEMPNQLVEVAITFDKPYTYEAIQQLIPSSLKINWYWIGTQSKVELLDLPLDNTFGTNELGLTEGRFLPSLEQAISSDKYHWITVNTSQKGKIVPLFSGKTDMRAYFEAYGHLDTRQPDDKAQLAFAGVILTGRSEACASLEKEPWIYASSIGASIPNQPYYQLEKE